MDKIYYGCFHKNADGTNQGIVAGERCLTPTNKCFWKDPNDVEHRIKARSRVKSQSIVSFLAVDRYNKGKNDKTIDFCVNKYLLIIITNIFTIHLLFFASFSVFGKFIISFYLSKVNNT